MGLESGGQDGTQTGHRVLPGLPDAEPVVVGTASWCPSGRTGKISLPAESGQEETIDSKEKLSSTDTGQNSFQRGGTALGTPSPKSPLSNLLKLQYIPQNPG